MCRKDLVKPRQALTPAFVPLQRALSQMLGEGEALADLGETIIKSPL